MGEARGKHEVAYKPECRADGFVFPLETNAQKSVPVLESSITIIFNTIQLELCPRGAQTSMQPFLLL